MQILCAVLLKQAGFLHFKTHVNEDIVRVVKVKFSSFTSLKVPMHHMKNTCTLNKLLYCVNRKKY